MNDPIKVKKEGSILEVTIDRPKANAIDSKTSIILGDVFADFRDNPDLRVAILTGAGEKFFSAGWDLKAASEGEAADADYGVGGFGGLQELPDLNKPIIGAINGIAAGIGLSIAMSADIRIAAESSKFSCIFVKRSLVPDGGATIMLQYLLGKGIAMEMSLTGNIYDSEWALSRGLINQLTPDSLLLHSAFEIAAIIASNPPLAVRAVKGIMNEVTQLLPKVIESENKANNLLLQTGDFQESILAFEEKRPPTYKGV